MGVARIVFLWSVERRCQDGEVPPALTPMVKPSSRAWPLGRTL